MTNWHFVTANIIEPYFIFLNDSRLLSIINAWFLVQYSTVLHEKLMVTKLLKN
jgi:hypothetical protein